MAKKTKNSNLSIEERLEQVLIPRWDEPYKLPDNWCWTHVKYCCDDFFCGKSPQYSKTDTGYHIIGQQANQRYGLDLRHIKFATKEFAESQAQRYWLRKKDVILNTLGTGSIGRSGIININDSLLTDGHLFVFRANKYVVPEYLFYYFQLTEEEIIRGANGSTNQKFLSLSSFAQYAIPIPTLAEQHRIVSHIESLFDKLDEAKEKVQEVVDGFDGRRAAILHRAFSGELTAKWREENQHSIEEWTNRSISELCASLKYGTAKKSKDEGPVVVLRMGNLQQGEIDWTDLAFTDDPEDIEKFKLYPGDVLFNRTNSAVLVGKTSIYRGEYPAIFAGYLIKLDYDHDSIVGDYLNYALNTANAKEYCNMVKTDGVNQSNINAKKIGAFVIPVPSMREQEEIVRIVNALLSKEKAAKEAAESVIEQIGAMKKAILSRAFRGELGTNDPTEKSSVELLKSIVADGKI